MNMESTIDVRAVVTPNCAIARRSHTSSYSTLQNPEMKKNTKNHAMLVTLHVRLYQNAAINRPIPYDSYLNHHYRLRGYGALRECHEQAIVLRFLFIVS